jgi:YidC/Oxa1 family membrane protein insertase
MALLSLFATQVASPKGVWEPLLQLFSFVANYGWRVILFTVILKLVLSPLDIFQRYKMKKNAKITKELQPEIEKLQKQYANDKRLLQEKQTQLTKNAGVSVFSSCLPMIVTLLVFFSFFAGMTNISAYEEFRQYTDRYDVYVAQYAADTGLDFTDSTKWNPDDPSVRFDEFDKRIDEWGATLESVNDSAYLHYSEYKGKDEKGAFFAMYSDNLKEKQIRDFFVASRVKPQDESKYSINIFIGEKEFSIKKINDFQPTAPSEQQPLSIEQQNAQLAAAKAEVVMLINAELAKYVAAGQQVQSGVFPAQVSDFSQVYQYYESVAKYESLQKSLSEILKVSEDYASQKVYEYYKEGNNSKFLWIKSIWISDSPLQDGVLSYDKFSSNVSKYINDNKGELNATVLASLSKESTYNKVMSKIKADKSMSGANGYFILAILTALFSFLSQFISSRQQKQSGQVTAAQGGGTMKMMMYILPLISVVFAVIYTSAFAIYMITNSFMTLLINLISSFFIDMIEKKKARNQLSEAGVVKYGRRDPNESNFDKRR